MIRHALPFLVPPAYLSRINSTLINYDYSIWMWVKSLKYYAWKYFSSIPSSVVCSLLLQPDEPRKKSKKRALPEPAQQTKKMQRLEGTSRYALRKVVGHVPKRGGS